MGWDNPEQEAPAFLRTPHHANDNERRKGPLQWLWELLFGKTY